MNYAIAEVSLSEATITETSMLEEESAMAECLLTDEKSAIAQAFSRAANSYDQHAEFQRDVGHRLLELLPKSLTGKVVLDLGCGTGYFSRLLQDRGAQVICADLSQAMLSQAQRRCGDKGMTYLLADAESLPLESDSVDFVFSSLALQWCSTLSAPLSEIRRVTKPLGQAVFSTLLDGSLCELKRSWSKIDSHQHVIDFVTLSDVKIALAQSKCDEHHLNLPEITVWYSSALSLMKDLKGIGAGHVSGRSQGLTSRRTLLNVEKQYQTFKNHQGLLPATYQVCLGVIQL